MVQRSDSCAGLSPQQLRTSRSGGVGEAITIVIGAWVVAVVRVKMISHKVSFPFSIHFQKLTIVTLQAW